MLGTFVSRMSRVVLVLGTATATLVVSFGVPVAAVALGRVVAHGPIVPLGRAGPMSGILPPRNPPKNLVPVPNFYASCAPGALDDTAACNSKALQAIDRARGAEPVGPLQLNLARFLDLNVADQLFVIADLERVSRGEPPMTALTAQLDGVAQAAANANGDPELSAERLSGGVDVRAWGSNWAGGSESVLGSDDGWMYDDGYGSDNGGCTSPGAAECWGHRDNILQPWTKDLSGCPQGDSQLVMGAAYAKSSKWATSFAEIFVAACGPEPTGEVFTWTQAQAAIGLEPPTEVGLAASADGKGYLVVSSSGKVVATGDAHSRGGIAARSLAAPIVAVALDKAKTGYWLVGSDGEVYAFGGAPLYGDLRLDRLSRPVVAIAADLRSGGYWLVTSDGAVFGFHAPNYGDAHKRKLPGSIVAMLTDPGGTGYWLVGANGSVYPFGKVKSFGSEAGKRLRAPVVAAAVTDGGLGYLLVGRDGSVYNFGDASNLGSEAGKHLPAPIVAVAAAPGWTAYWLLGARGAVYRFSET